MRQRKNLVTAILLLALVSQTGCDKKLSEPGQKALTACSVSAAEAVKKWSELSDTLMASDKKDDAVVVKWNANFGAALSDRSAAYALFDSVAKDRPKFGKDAQDKISSDIKASYAMMENFSYFSKRVKGGKSDAEYQAWVAGMKACLEKHQKAVAELAAELLAKKEVVK